ncbi:MAG: fluoride efflux transporter CrcB [Pseudomonadota bacterium]
MKSLAFVFIGGGIGSLLRYLGVVGLQSFSAAFPYGTLSVNILGSFLIGFIAIFLEHDLSFDGARHLLVIGLLGGFTTFSAFSFESVDLLRAGNYAAASAYILASVAFCLAATMLGLWLGRMVVA